MSRIFLKIFYINLIFNIFLFFFHVTYNLRVIENTVNFFIPNLFINKIQIISNSINFYSIKYQNKKFDLTIDELQIFFNFDLLNYKKIFSSSSKLKNIKLQFNFTQSEMNFIENIAKEKNIFSFLIQLFLKNIYINNIYIYCRDLIIFSEKIIMNMNFLKDSIDINFIQALNNTLNVPINGNYQNSLLKLKKLLESKNVQSFFIKNKISYQTKNILSFNKKIGFFSNLFVPEIRKNKINNSSNYNKNFLHNKNILKINFNFHGKLNYTKNFLNWNIKTNCNNFFILEKKIYESKINNYFLEGYISKIKKNLIELNSKIISDNDKKTAYIFASFYHNAKYILKINNFYFSVDENTIFLQRNIANINNLNIQFYINFEILKFNGNFKLNFKKDNKNMYFLINLNKFLFGRLQIENIYLKGERFNIYNYKNIVFYLKNITIFKQIFVKKLYFNIWGNVYNHIACLLFQKNNYIKKIKIYGTYNNQKFWNGLIKFENLYKKENSYKVLLNNFFEINLHKNNFFIKHYSKNKKFIYIIAQHTILQTSNTIKIQIRDTNIEILNYFLPSKIFLKGLIHGYFELSLQQDRIVPDIKVYLTGNNIHIRYYQEFIQCKYSFETVKFFTILKQDKIYLSWKTQLENHSKFEGYINILNITNKYNISGYILFQKVPLTFLKPIMLHLNITGIINSEIFFNNFNIIGNTNIQLLSINNEFIKLEFISSEFNMKFLGNICILDGLVRTNKGTLKLNGIANWLDKNVRQVLINLSGNKIDLIILNFMKIEVSPDIKIKIKENLCTITGKIQLSQFFIEIEKIPNRTLRISPDEILFSKNNVSNILNKRKIIPYDIKIYSNISIFVENNLEIDLLNIKAKLKGNLKFVKNLYNINLNGRIEIISGYLNIYGQDLEIKKGQIIFSGPIKMPYIDLEANQYAFSNKQHTISSMQIFGALDHPKLYIFSDPEKSDQEIFSYLLDQNKIDAPNFDTKNILASMLLELGIMKSEYFIQKIGNILGIQNLSLDKQGLGNKSKILLSGSLFPKLKIKYGIGIFDITKSILTLSYKLTKNIYLEAISEENQAVDIIYRFDF
ncbi:putative exported protein [Wigglesworthia glossinidia endosymbiont of Glossina morsitans morsitans (Yale colony)]|uniref:Putative exported protein n=1 Tax=Wigglesworthia glossinidia endosymbiont of Glossina morsitans morsitans (Yale colony) TaxID=1142511 RepID=H6Q4Q6_WIGGL|nr:translocation/assembly module TamB domain-containing protein [Wigglesworthia glossinidia]AFA41116.1 putative exported protein [Wigglesworthia glossinidia endosymbiont of Glossina morsitans morsitans (Yale colony)]